MSTDQKKGVDILKSCTDNLSKAMEIKVLYLFIEYHVKGLRTSLQ